MEARWASWLADAVPGRRRVGRRRGGRWWPPDCSPPAGRRRPRPSRDLRRQLGHGWEAAADLADLRRPRAPLGGLGAGDVAGPEDLWRAEGRWWQRVDRDAAATLRAGRPGPEAAAAAAARLVGRRVADPGRAGGGGVGPGGRGGLRCPGVRTSCRNAWPAWPSWRPRRGGADVLARGGRRRRRRAGAAERAGAAPGEVADLERVTGASVARDGVRALAGWAPAAAVPGLADRLAPLGGTGGRAGPPGRCRTHPRCSPARGRGSGLRPLVDTYATVPYRDVDPTWFAAAAYVVMFGMMFGDVGDGAAARRRRAVAADQPPPPSGSGTAGVAAWWSPWACRPWSFGALYGELLRPDRPGRCGCGRSTSRPGCWRSGSGSGAALLAVAYGLGDREPLARGRPRPGAVRAERAGRRRAVRRLSRWWPAGCCAGSAVAVGRRASSSPPLALVLVAVGLRVGAGPGAAGRAAGVGRADRRGRSGSGSNVVSFARLAAFGLTHAALGQVVWDATTVAVAGRARRWRARSWCSSSGTSWRSASRPWWPGCRRCASSTTSCSRGSSSPRAAPSGRGTCRAGDHRLIRGGAMFAWLIALPAFAAVSALTTGRAAPASRSRRCAGCGG